jgi:hypothetical protein
MGLEAAAASTEAQTLLLLLLRLLHTRSSLL